MKTPLKNKTVLITAGPTREAMDPVRFLSNASSGAVGIEIAKAFRDKKANVTMVLGPTHLPPPVGVKTIRVTTALEMNTHVQKLLKKADVFVASAAVGDWRFHHTSSHKIKKGTQPRMHVLLVRNSDILAEAGRLKKIHKNLVLIGFALETKNKILEAKKKLDRKNLDLVVANDPRSFSSKKIKSTWIDRNKNIIKHPLLSKAQFAKRLVKWVYGY